MNIEEHLKKKKDRVDLPKTTQCALRLSGEFKLRGYFFILFIFQIDSLLSP